MKLGIPYCKWLKLPRLDSFITSTIPKDVIRVDATTQKTHKLWLEETAPLTAIIEKMDAGNIDQAEAIQGIRAALVLLRNAFQHHAIQWRKAVIQHLNPQLKLLVKDEDFAIAAPFLFGPKFGEIAKEQLEAAALIQKTQPKFSKALPELLGPLGWQQRKQWSQQKGNLAGWGFKDSRSWKEMTRDSCSRQCF